MSDNTSDKDPTDNFWPDIMTCEINRFRYDNSTTQITLSEQAVVRLDLLMSAFYNKSEYDDIVLFLNNIEYKQDLTPSEKFLLTDKRDLERFFTDRTV